MEEENREKQLAYLIGFLKYLRKRRIINRKYSKKKRWIKSPSFK